MCIHTNVYSFVMEWERGRKEGVREKDREKEGEREEGGRKEGGREKWGK